MSDKQIPLMRRTPLPLASRFESIRSSEIPGIFQSRFEVVEKRETLALVNYVVPMGTRSAYLESDEGRVLFELLMVLDDVCVKSGYLRPVTGQYVLRKRHAGAPDVAS
jgi:hypothetical protein